MIHAVSKVKKRGVDLTWKLVQSSIFSSEDGNEYRKNAVCPTHGFLAMDDLRPHCRPLRRQPPGAHLVVRRTVPGDVHALDLLVPEAGSIYVMDRGYIDFARLHALHRAGGFFVTRAKSNLSRVVY